MKYSGQVIHDTITPWKCSIKMGHDLVVYEYFIYNNLPLVCDKGDLDIVSLGLKDPICHKVNLSIGKVLILTPFSFVLDRKTEIEGQLVLGVSNNTNLPLIIEPGETLCQAIFILGEREEKT